MTRWISSFVATVMLTFLAPLSAAGEDSSWKMPNLNPFASKGKTASRASSAPTSGWHMPKLWQTTKSPVRPKPRPANQPSTWSRMTNGTQQFFAKTADTLTPWDNKKAAPPPKITGSNSIFTQQSKPKEKDSSGILPASWWSGEKSDQPDKTVNDFLARPRPH